MGNGDPCCGEQKGPREDGALAMNENSRDVVCAENFKITPPSVHRRRIHLTICFIESNNGV